MRTFIQRILLGSFLVLMAAVPAHADDSGGSSFFSSLSGMLQNVGSGISGFFQKLGAEASNNTSSAAPTSNSGDQAQGAAPNPNSMFPAFPDGGIGTSNVTTQNASFNPDTMTPSDARWLMLRVIKSGGSDAGYQSVAPAVPGQPLPTVYMAEGPGDYTIQFFYTSDPDRSASMSLLTSFQATNTDQDDLSFLLPSLEVQSQSSDIVALANQLTQGLSNDMDKSRAIHDWVASNVAYDVSAYFSGNYVNKAYDSETIMQTRIAICDGYSNLNAALHRAIGIPAREVQGMLYGVACNTSTATTHAWNEIYIDGRWVTEDTTWDAGGVNFQTQQFTPMLSETYFDPDPAMFAQTHTRCNIALK
jgi:hypothetical protein